MHRMKTKLYYAIVLFIVVYILYKILQFTDVLKSGVRMTQLEEDPPRHNILLVGVGNIGVRHFQSLLKLKGAVDITIVDPYGPALQRAMKMYESETSKNRQSRVNFLETLNVVSMGTQFDVGIIATAADVRRMVVEDVLICCKLRYLILEKVLFQTSEDHKEVSKLLQKYDVTTYVNSQWSTFPLGKYLKKKFKPPVNMLIQGNDWGLCCNSIHFLTLSSFLNDGADISIDGTSLLPGYRPSKRQGFVEIFGELIGKFRFSHGEASVRMESGRDENLSKGRVFIVWNDDGEITWTEKTGILQGTFKSAKNAKTYSESKTFPLPMVSSWTHEMVSGKDGGDIICVILAAALYRLPNLSPLRA
ncbi:uncharacterized protein LOC144445258 [Glandiceps talaboti]